MTQEEEEDLEDELKKLDIREDLGDEDSDVTPTNSTPVASPPTIATKWRYPSSKSSGFCDLPRVDRYSFYDDYDSSRSNSSLSWGEDEFEGEATRMVSSLFDMLDTVLYKEENEPTFKVPAFNTSLLSDMTSNHQISDGNVTENSEFFSKENKNSIDKNVNFIKELDQEISYLNQNVDTNLIPIDKGLETNLISYNRDKTDVYTESIYDDSMVAYENILNHPNKIKTYYEVPKKSLTNSIGNYDHSSTPSENRLLSSIHNYGDHNTINLKPSKEMEEECHNWLQHFPHFRIKGIKVQPKVLEEIELKIAPDIAHRNGLEEGIKNIQLDEEIIDNDGDYSDLLSTVTLPKSYSATKKKAPSHSTPSRVCSGSNDPEVLREHLLISIFDNLWPEITEILLPLLSKYARYIIEQSVQLSSLSRESSTNGKRLKENVNSRNNLEPIRMSSALDNRTRNTRFNNARINDTERKLSRPSSAINRLPSADLHSRGIKVSQLHELLLITSKPLQHNEEKIQSNKSSALRRRYSLQSHSSSIVSLPTLNTSHNGGSSMSTPRTPPANMGTHFSNNPAMMFMTGHEQRPSSTSSYPRKKIQNRFHQFSLTGTIQESNDFPNDSKDHEEDAISTNHNSRSNWSKHVPFLPPINQYSPNPISDKMSSSNPDPNLRIRGTSMSALRRSPGARRTWDIPITEARKKIEMKWFEK